MQDQNKPNTPEPLTKAEEIELENLFRELFNGEIEHKPVDEYTETVRRYDELRSKQLTYLSYQITEQIKAERRLAMLN
jgi:hypothetical protein